MVERKDKGKAMLATLTPLGAIEAIARASEVGLTKYHRDSFRDEGGYTLSQCLNAAVRHIFKRTGGERYDPDAAQYLDGRQIDHLDLAIWNLAAATEAQRLYGDACDDLWKGPNPARFQRNEAGIFVRIEEPHGAEHSKK